jgi:hypothetical protein
MAVLNKAEILAAKDTKIQKMPVPEWGEGAEICVRSLTALERDQFEASLVTFKDGTPTPKIENYRSRLCALSICDEDGKRLFTDSEIQDLGKKSGEVLDRIASVANELSHLNEKAIKKAAEVLKNAPSADLPTA